MNLDTLIAQLTEIRDRAAGNGNLPMEINLGDKFARDVLVIPFCEQGGPSNDDTPLTGVQITSVF